MIAIRTILSMLLLWASVAQAFIDPPVITPENPTTDTYVEAAVRYGVCDALLRYTFEYNASGLNLTIVKVPTQSDPFCNNPISTYAFVLPLLPEGQHLFSIYLQDSRPPDSQRVLWFQTTLDILPANGGPLPKPVPIFAGWVQLLLLASGLLTIATWRLAGSTPVFGGERNR